MAAQHTGAGREEPVDPVFVELAEIRQEVVEERDPKERVSGRFQALPDLRCPTRRFRWSVSVPLAQVGFNCKTRPRAPPQRSILQRSHPTTSPPCRASPHAARSRVARGI
jgi:hypothetical protein